MLWAPLVNEAAGLQARRMRDGAPADDTDDVSPHILRAHRRQMADIERLRGRLAAVRQLHLQTAAVAAVAAEIEMGERGGDLDACAVVASPPPLRRAAGAPSSPTARRDGSASLRVPRPAAINPADL